MNVSFVRTIQSQTKRNAYIDKCVQYFNLRIWITLFQSLQQNSTTYEKHSLHEFAREHSSEQFSFGHCVACCY